MKLPIHVQVGRDGVRVFCPDLPGCSASARTEEEALLRLKGRIQAWFRTPTAPAPGTRIIHVEV